jgi:predicted nucleotide-binding protein
MAIPRIVVRSWRATLPLAHAIQTDLGHDFDVTVWEESIVGDPNRLDELAEFDAAIFVVAAESPKSIRFNEKRRWESALLELGMFLGRFGRQRTFLILPRSRDKFTWPNDLAGLATLPYETQRTFSDWQSSIGPACAEIRRNLGDLLTSSTERVLLADLRRALESPATYETYPPRVFLSYSSQDRLAAERIATALESEGVTEPLRWELSSGDSIQRRVEEAARSSDLVVCLLSPSAVQSSWARHELTSDFRRKLDDRAVRFLPTVVADCRVPEALASKHYYDLRSHSKKSLRTFVRNLSVAPAIDFSALDWRAFERLVVELLKVLGFSVRRSGATSPFDYIASRKVASASERWLVETKFYSRERASVAALRELVTQLDASTTVTNAMLITNSRLTSVAREYLGDTMVRSQRALRVIDGGELTDLLIQNPSVAEKYFGSEGG